MAEIKYTVTYEKVDNEYYSDLKYGKLSLFRAGPFSNIENARWTTDFIINGKLAKEITRVGELKESIRG